MNKYYLVKYTDNYADEFDVYGLALLTDTDRKYFNNLEQEDLPITHYIGTNEEITYEHLNKLLRCYTWIEITELEYKLLDRLIGSDYGRFYYPELDEDDDDI